MLAKLLGELEKVTRLYAVSEENRAALEEKQKELVSQVKSLREKFAGIAVEIEGVRREKETQKTVFDGQIYEMQLIVQGKEGEIAELREKNSRLDVLTMEIQGFDSRIREK